MTQQPDSKQQHQQVNLSEFRELKLKYEQAVRLAAVDQKVRQELVEDLEKAWGQANLAKSKEKSKLETVKSLKLEVSNLSKLVEQGVGVTMGQEYNIREVLKEKEALLNENKQLSEEMSEMKVRMSQLELKEIVSDKKIEGLRSEVAEAVQETRAKELAIQGWMRRCERLDDELQNQKRIHENKELAMLRLNQSVEPLRAEKAKLELGLRDAHLSLEKTRKELDITNARHTRLQNELDQLYLQHDTLQVDNGQLVQQIRRGQELIDAHKVEYASVQKNREMFERRLKALEAERNALLSDNQILQKRIESDEKKLDEFIVRAEGDRKRIDSLVVEKELLNSELRKARFELERLAVELRKFRTESKVLRKDISRLNKINAASSSKVLGCEKEKVKLVESVNNLTRKLKQVSYAFQMKSLHMKRLGNELVINGRKLNELEGLVSLSKTGKDRFRKENQSLVDEINSLKVDLLKFESTEHEVTRLLKEKEASLENAMKSINYYKKQVTELNRKVERREIVINELRSQLELEGKNEGTLLEEINGLNLNVKKLEKDRTELATTRNVFGTQLVRRNDEIALLYEKIRLLEGVLTRGCQAYDSCSARLREAERKLVSFKNETILLANERKLTHELRRALAASERELGLERVKLRALESEQTQIFNVHKWRDMSLREPATYELVSKVGMLQKRLVAKSEQVACLRMTFVEKDRIFVELKQLLARRLVNEEHVVEREMMKKWQSGSIRKNKVWKIYFVKVTGCN
jgi:chromosome segregation ATPase